MTRTIDAHHHFWRTAAQEQPWRQASHTTLVRDFEPADLEPELVAAGVDATILMQSVDEPAENDRLAGYAADPRVAGVVAWLPLRRSAEARAELDGLDLPKLVGVRCLVATDPLDWLGDPESLALFADLAARGLVWDVVPITRAQTDAVLRLARRLPELRIVVDHLGRPPLETRGWKPWAGQLAELAACPNVAVKASVGIDALSALETWDLGVIEPYVRFATDQFGPSRTMLASNWPVVLLRASYRSAWDGLGSLLLADHPDEADRAALLGGTAARWYGIAAEPLAARGEEVASTRP